MDYKRVIPYEGYEVIELGKDGMEFNNGFMWFLSDLFIGKILAKIIESKTIKLIKDNADNGANLDPEEINIIINGTDEERQKVLSKFRRNFPNQRRISDVFEIETFGFNRFSPTLKHLCQNAANAPALDDGYNVIGSFEWNNKTLWPESKSSLDPFAWFWGKYHANFPSVRNRYRIVKHLFTKMGGGESLSIASGSAQALIHGAKEVLDETGKIDFQITLTDTNDDSLDLAMRRARDAGIIDCIQAVNAPFQKLPEVLENKKFKVVEACGILDYLPNKHASTLIKFALSSLENDGIAIMSNMNNTNAGPLLSKLFNWDIIYRTPEQLGELIYKSGGKNVKVYVEPWKIHPVVTFSK